MPPKLKINTCSEEKSKRCLVLCVGVILWINQPWISAGAKCGRPGRTAHNNYVPVGKEFNENDVIQYSCDKEDHVILGPSSRRCLGNGSWSDEIPVCSKVGKIEMIEVPLQDANDIEGKYSFDGDISTCSELPYYEETIWTGYLSLPVNVTAVRISVLGLNEVGFDVTIQGETTREKKCEKKEARSAVSEKPITTITNYCPPGTVGNIVHIKRSDQAFKVCEVSVLLPPVQACLTPDNPLHGTGFMRFSGNETVYQFSCNSGYKRWGSLLAFCQTDGTWSPKSPICDEIYCTAPENPSNGHVEYDHHRRGVPYNGSAQYSCNEGYYLDGPSTIRCHQWDAWDYPPPKCKPEPTETSRNFSSTSLTQSKMESNDEACGTFNDGESNHGNWIFVNESSSFQVLICPEGFHIEGSPAVTRCLSNGSWSYTSAICKKSFKNVWGSQWTPSLILIAATAVGAGTAIFILCLAIIFFVLKKRRQTSTNTTVFHLQNAQQKVEMSEKNIHRHKHFSATEIYESVIERRSKSACTNPRKPRSALPNLPLDADPVYAQPFEAGPTVKKLSNATASRKEDLYNTHIYAEPIDSRLTNPSNIPVSVILPRIGKDMRESVVKTNFEKELPLPIPENTQHCDKKCAIYDSSISSSQNGGYVRTGDIQLRCNEDTGLGTLKKNTEYLELS